MEAAISTTMFLILVLYAINYMTILGQVFQRQTYLDSVVKQLSKAAYYLEVANRITDQNGKLKEQKQQVEEKIQQFQEMGISLTDSFYKNGLVDIRLNYVVSTVFWNHRIEILQRAQIRDWRGTDLCEKKKVVYTTKNGTVYHRNRNCSHLKLNISSVNFQSIHKYRNEGGEKYKACEKCIKSENNVGTVIYITKEGNRYHNSVDCSGLRRYIIEIDEKEVGKRTPCKKCGGTDG